MSAPYYADASVTLHHGDCLDVLRALPDVSVDAVVTDPPYGLGFMGREWDALPPGREWAEECLRVLKPGGHLISAGGSRTYHRMTCAVEDAGFEIRDCITWHFGSGFPKSRNVSLDLARLPACSCDVPSEVGTVDAGLPAGAVGTGVGAEAGAVSLAGLATDVASGVGPQLLADATGRSAVVNALGVDAFGEDLPVVLGPSAVAGAAEGQEIVGGVGRVEVDPEALRDQVVGDEVVGRSTVGAGPIAGDDASGDVGPASSLVLPLAAAPSGIGGPVESGAIADGHASSGAVDAPVGPVAELDPAGGAGVDAVALASHGSHSTAERAVRCEACGGVAGEIPQGLGTALKPATEFFVVARKPLAGTVAGNVLAHGTGALNVDACRVESSEVWGGNNAPSASANGYGPNDADGWQGNWTKRSGSHTSGRWPANVVLDESQAEALDEQSGELTSGANPTRRGSDKFRDAYGDFAGQEECTPARGADSGGASRFFYTAKASADERVRVNGTAHPTVKPLALMRWLVRLVTPPGGTVLEPFAGSGTTVEACILEGFRCVAVEREAHYLPLIVQRIHRRRDPVEAVRGSGEDGGLFDLLEGDPA